MIRADFRRNHTSFIGVTVRGHANFAEYGEDIVCAGVTSALQLTANGITEVLAVKALVVTKENLIAITLPEHAPQSASDFLNALYIHLEALQEDYPDNIKLTLAEV